MKGYIIVNPFKIPVENVHQAERLKEEFAKLDVSVEIIFDAYIYSCADSFGTANPLAKSDFIVYLDKDKYLSEILSKSGARLFNTHSSVRICDDKGQTYIALSGQGVKIPKTLFGALCYLKDCQIDQGAVNKIESSLGYPIIVKESFGSQGKGVYLANNRTELLSIMEDVKLKPHLFQEYVDCKKGTDVRIIVIGKKAVACMERHNDKDFRSNVARGGNGIKIVPPKSFIETAEKCAEILGLDYCGVDLLYGADGEPIVCEVNSNAFIDGIEKATNINVAGAYAKYIVDSVKNSAKNDVVE